MKRVLGLLLLIVHSFAFEFDEFSSFQGKLSKEYVTGKISRYLQYNQEIENYFEIQDDALVLFKSPEAKRQGIYEFRLVFGKENSKSSVKSKPLDKVRIAIDPGHFGGQFARLEERFIDVDFEGTHLEIDEGRLSFLTAMRLKELLEKAGVSVMVTRKKIGEGVYSEDFFDWLKAHPEYWEKGVALSEIFRRHYNRLDLRERARVINEYRPDLTVVIHYNHVGGGEGQITEKNFNFVFVPGAFCKDELSTEEDRYHFLRLICMDDLESSLTLAGEMVKQLSNRLGVPPFDQPMENTLSTSCGIYSRNLCLTRLVKGPICYGESLVQNNEEELLKLSRNDGEIGGVPCPKRVLEVAEAYFEAIIGYLKGRAFLGQSEESSPLPKGKSQFRS